MRKALRCLYRFILVNMFFSLWSPLLAQPRTGQARRPRPKVTAPIPEIVSFEPESIAVQSEKLSRFQKVYRWLEENKLCLTGTDCPVWLSLTAHYMLGVAISMGWNLASSVVKEQYWKGAQRLSLAKPGQEEFKEQTSLKKGISTGAEIVFNRMIFSPLLALYLLAKKMGYEKLLATETASVVFDPLVSLISSWQGKKGLFTATMKCLLKGDGCDIDQRRRTFFEAGLLTGTTVGSLAKAALKAMNKAVGTIVGIQ